MPYVPPEVTERLKREVSIQRLAEARGIKLHAQRQGADRAVPVPRRPQPQPEHRPGEECVALQGRVRRGRRRDPVGDAGRGRELPSCAGVAESETILPLAAGPISREDQRTVREAAAADRRHRRTTRSCCCMVVDYYHGTLKDVAGGAAVSQSSAAFNRRR